MQSEKVAGMLVDVSLESNKIENLVLGVGINFDVNVKQIEKSLKEMASWFKLAVCIGVNGAHGFDGAHS